MPSRLEKSARQIGGGRRHATSAPPVQMRPEISKKGDARASKRAETVEIWKRVAFVTENNEEVLWQNNQHA